MSDPLAVRLRALVATDTEQLQAAQLIDSLVAENEQMRAALEPFGAVADEYADQEDDSFEVWQDAGPIPLIRSSFRLKMYRAARAALG